VVETTKEIFLSKDIVFNYFSSLVNHFFKILPMFESKEESLSTYLESLQVELLGFEGLVVAINNDPYYLVLLSILQYFIDNPDASVKVVKREVFRAISICNRLKACYASEVEK
jgi:hypothetical protein